MVLITKDNELNEVDCQEQFAGIVPLSIESKREIES
jgi:hypothetical protein